MLLLAQIFVGGMCACLCNESHVVNKIGTAVSRNTIVESFMVCSVHAEQIKNEICCCISMNKI